MSFGPQLPPHLLLLAREEGEMGATTPEEPETGSASAVYGPILPPSDAAGKALLVVREEDPDDDVDDDDDSSLIGPLPPTQNVDEMSTAQRAIHSSLEHSARSIADESGDGAKKASDSSDVLRRETWMLELPALKKGGLGALGFARSKKPERDETWLETPQDRQRRQEKGADVTREKGKSACQDRDVLEYMASLKRDQEMEQAAKALGSKRSKKSLVELHEIEAKKKMKKKSGEGSRNERRPFDRDVDLGVNRFDEAAKRSALKMAKKVNDRFSAGEQKYL